MPSSLQYILRRLMAIPITLVLLTAVMYGVLMLAPVEARAQLYMPRGSSNNPELKPEVVLQRVIEEHGLNDPYPLQYIRWLGLLVRGDWGWSPGLRTDVFEALLVRTPVTAELTLYSILFLVPLGMISGVIAGWRYDRAPDLSFRLAAFIATSVPPFILGLVLLGIFYAGLKWFPSGRLSLSESLVVASENFHNYTGLLTVDGLLNGRFDITLSALRHLVLPVITLSLAHWATLGRVTRATIIEEMKKDYVITAHGKGLPEQSVVWRHIGRNAMVPALNSTALSAAALIMGVFVVEVVFNLPGVSELIANAVGNQPDVPIAMGFAVYCVLLVLPLMLILDILQGITDPRIRENRGDF